MITKHIIKQIWNERRSNSWIWAELLLVSIALWVIVDWGYVQLSTYLQPRGFDYEHTYQLRFNKLTPKSVNYIPGDQKTTTDGDDFLAILERLRHNPDIEYVSVSHNSSPYNGSNSSWGLRHDSTYINRLARVCTPDFFNVFRYENVDGSGSQSLADALKENALVVSSNLCEEEFPGGKELLGADFYFGGDTVNPVKIAAITTPVRYGDYEPDWGRPYFSKLLTEKEISETSGSDLSYGEVCLRVRPEASKEFPENLLKDSPRLYNVGNMYIQNIQSFDDIRRSFQLDTVNEVQKRMFVLLFLMVNIFLGIVGTFWYRTQQRRSELGLRVALGSSHRGLSTLLMGEGVLLLVSAFLPALIACYNIGVADPMNVWEMKWGLARFIPGALITFVLMLLMIVAGIWFPARQAMKIEPAEALHNE